MQDERIERWLAALVATPGLTAVRDVAEARRVHLDGALAGAALVRQGPVVDVGSGGGSPGLPLAAALPHFEVALLEANGKKCRFLREWAGAFPNASVVCARAEEHAAGEGRDAYACAVARALAPLAVAAEWCLPLVRPGGSVVLYAGEADARPLAAVSERLGGGLPEVLAEPGSERRRLVVIPKLEPTPEGFPRRPGLARKRPLA